MGEFKNTLPLQQEADVDSKWNGLQKTESQATTPLAWNKCYICGSMHLTAKSLELHTRACRWRFEQCEAKRPPAKRRPLLEEHALPCGVDCLEKYYESMEQSATILKARELHGPAARVKRCPIEEWLAAQPQSISQCPELEHLGAEKGASKREEVSKAKPCPKKPIQASNQSYKSFCHRLEKCVQCGRSFRPGLMN